MPVMKQTMSDFKVEVEWHRGCGLSLALLISYPGFAVQVKQKNSFTKRLWGNSFLIFWGLLKQILDKLW